MARRPNVLRTETAGGFYGQPPAQNLSSGGMFPPEGLTAKFNRAAKPAKLVPASKQQIEELKKKMSRPALTLERNPLGSVVRSYDPNRDRKVQFQIKSIQKKLSKKNDLARKAFTRAVEKNQFKRNVGKSSGRKM